VKGNLYTLVYAAILGTVCAALLTGVGEVTRAQIADNEKAEELRNILAVLEVPFDPAAGPQELIAISGQYVREEMRGGLALLVYVEEGQTRAVAVLFAGPGLWGPVEGYLSLDPEMKTIRGVTFHKQEETPGLGGEIGSESFRSRFRGRKIESADGRPGIRIVGAGVASGLNEVDGITSATMTCKKVEAMLNEAIVKVVEARGKDG